jgi:hypothetical protein
LAAKSLGEIALALAHGRFIKDNMSERGAIGFPASDGGS